MASGIYTVYTLNTSGQNKKLNSTNTTVTISDTKNGTSDNTNILGDVSNDAFTTTTNSGTFTLPASYTYSGTFTSGTSNGFYATGSDGTLYYFSTDSTLTNARDTDTPDTTPPPSGTYNTTEWNLTNNSPACFVRGTRVTTSNGEVAVEDLREGALLLTRSGAYKPLRWIGRRSLVTALIVPEERAALLPVRIARGALGEGLPQRDLLVSPEHCMLIDGVLIPAGHLVNGISITSCDSLEIIEYFHLELPAHDVILAEGAPTETYLDCGNRNMFENVEEYVAHYGLGDAVSPRSCLPVVKDGARLTAARRRLRELAESGEADDSVASPASGFAPASLGIGGARATL